MRKAKSKVTTAAMSIIGEISDSSYAEFSARLSELESQEVSIVEIELYSGGGDAKAALAFYSRMRLSSCTFHVTGFGLVASAAGLILVGADYRRMTKEAWFMTHEDTGKDSGTVSQREVSLAHGRDCETQWNEILAKHSNMTDVSFWNEYNTQDRFMTAYECLNFGLIDEVL